MFWKEDIKTVSELKKKTNEIFSQMHKTGRPIVVTVNGKTRCGHDGRGGLPKSSGRSIWPRSSRKPNPTSKKPHTARAGFSEGMVR